MWWCASVRGRIGSNYERHKDHSTIQPTIIGPKSGWGKRGFVEGRLLSRFKFPETCVIERDGVIRRKFIGATDWTNPEIVAYLNKLYRGTQSEIGEDLVHEKSCNRNVQSQVVGREALQRLAKAHPRQCSVRV